MRANGRAAATILVLVCFGCGPVPSTQDEGGMDGADVPQDTPVEPDAGPTCSAAASFAFAPGAQSPPIGGYAVDLAHGDFNEDGRVDLAVGNDNRGQVSIVLGGGDGTFGAPSSFVAGTQVFGVALADFDENRHIDLAVADNAGVTALIGAGDGTFAVQSVGPVPAGSVAVAVGDFDGDGHEDAATTDGVHITLFLGHGDATFETAPTPSLEAGAPLAAGDLDGDGLEDLVATRVSVYGLIVYRATGGGLFAAEPPIDLTRAPVNVFVADYDGDGVLDVVATLGGAAAVLIGLGGASFAVPVVTYDPLGLFYAMDSDLADFNCDGTPDLAVAQLSSGFSVVRGNADGTFTYEAANHFGGAFGGTTAATAADLDGDGRVDVAAANRTGSLSVPGTIVVLLNVTAP